jgi:hypothetical protein
MRIVDRADGKLLLEVPDDQGRLLTDLAEDVQSFQVSELFLEVAAQEGVDASILDRLRQELSRCPTLFVGGDPVPDGEVTHRLGGQLVDHDGKPLGGLVVTAQGSQGDAASWAFSGPDGHFELGFAAQPDWKDLELLVSSRGGLLLLSFELDELDDKVERMDPFVIATVRGRVLTADGQPLSGGRVEAWSTWAVTNEEGAFQIPVDRLGEELYLEVFAPSGQPLGGYWKVRLPESEPIDLGEHSVPVPDPDWPDSDEPLIAAEFGVDSVFPGVSDHPLS